MAIESGQLMTVGQKIVNSRSAANPLTKGHNELNEQSSVAVTIGQCQVYWTEELRAKAREAEARAIEESKRRGLWGRSP